MSKVQSGGTPLITLLLVLFIGLKLTGIITWSWWWVFAPVWIPILLSLVIFFITIIIYIIFKK